MEYSLEDIAGIVGGKAFIKVPGHQTISDILIDSRKLITPKQALFFALTTGKNDGHRYIDELVQRGVRNFVISNNEYLRTDANMILVDNTLTALQQLAARHRQRFDIPVIGITGSNGKTIIKEWLFQLMSPDYRITRSPKSYNSQVGVPLSVWALNPNSQLGIFEAGISEPDEMDPLQKIIKPTIGVFANIGPSHSENFINITQKTGEKLKLFTHVEKLIYCTGYNDIRETIIRSGMAGNIKLFGWGRNPGDAIRLQSFVEKPGETLLVVTIGKEEFRFSIPFTDEASVENAMHCWVTMWVMGYDMHEVAGRFRNLQPVAMRLEVKEGINRCLLINDSYNNDIHSLRIALDFLRQQSHHEKRTLILSDILQSGINDNELYEEVSRMVEQSGVQRFIGIGPALMNQTAKFGKDALFFPSTQKFLSVFPFGEFQNETILLKGARKFEFESITQQLQQKAHETVLEVNLNALVHNLDYFRNKLPEGTRIMAMVKAFSYGSGSIEIASVLQYHQVDYLSVAYADEGVELRKAGIKMPIMVMNPDEQSFDAIIKHNLEPEIYNFRSLELLEEATRANLIPENKPVKVHIKLDTGMHRLGFGTDEIEELIGRLKKIRSIYVVSVFSHLAASDDPGADDFTRRQIEVFRNGAGKIASGADHPVMLHILNTAGISRFPEATFDMVRLGIGLYGITAVEEDRRNLENVSTLRSIISQIKTVKPGEIVGYNRSWVAEKETRIGIVPVGYADGISRRMGNGVGSFLIRGKRVPLIGEVCMDMCMVDLSDLDEVREGDTIIIFGRDLPVQEVADSIGTIPYELLAGISRRVKRIYFHE
ncbi:MAG: bifunctional UDP-N-acetylmuramoyl-tripeptide:D-alanyl-D-alanine ligase/alanine racemase [Bacteroidales bacterium]